MARYRLLKNSTRGARGEVVEIDSAVHVAQLRQHGIIGEAEADRSPEVKKVVEGAEVKKTRRRRRKADTLDE